MGFIYLFFKMATEVNVFAHLGRTLFSHMKESLFSDVKGSDSEDEIEEKQEEFPKEEPVTETVPSEIEALLVGNGNVSSENGNVSGENKKEKKDSIAECIAI